MPSNNPNIFKRAYENLMGTPEQNKKAKDEIEKYKASKAREKEKEEEDKKKMAKGGAVKGFKPCAACPSPAKCKAAGKCLKTKMAKGGTVPGKGKVVKSGSKAAKTGKTPLLAIMIGVPKAAKKK